MILYISTPAYSVGAIKHILKGLKPNSITLIGESYKPPESIALFESLITQYLQQQDKCLIAALEIASGQQVLINEIMQREGDVENIGIASPIDHPSLRKLIQDLAQMHRHGRCVRIVAVDADFKPGVDRDQWMAKEFIRLSGEVSVLALLGSLHTLKEVDWRYKELGNKLYVAGILATKGLDIKFYPQAWTDRHCNSSPRFISADTSEATEILNNNVMSSLNAFKQETAMGVVDGIILWECR